MAPRAVLVLLGTSLAATFVWLAWASGLDSAVNPWIIGVALVLHGGLWWLGRHGLQLSVRSALVVVGAALTIAALLPLHQSRDLYLYDAYGRAVAEHHVNPYTHTPSDLDDPAVALVAEQWHDQPSMYGPAFVALAAAASELGGGSELRIRLVWQLMTAAAAFAAVALVARRTRDPMATLVLGCSPVLLLAVNDAHNDVLVGLGLVALVLLVEQHRNVAAGAVAAMVIATKVPAAAPVAAVACWVWWRQGWSALVRFIVPVVAAVGIAYLLVGGAEALLPLRDSAGDDSRFALWQPLRDSTFEAMLADGVAWRTTLETVRDRMSTYSTTLMAAAAGVVLWRHRRAALPGDAVSAVLLVVLLASTYVMPWYAAMALPVAALAWRSRASRLLQVQAAFLVVAYAQRPGVDPSTWAGRWLEQHAIWINAALLGATVFWTRPSRVVDVDHPVDPPRPRPRRRSELLARA